MVVVEMPNPPAFFVIAALISYHIDQRQSIGGFSPARMLVSKEQTVNVHGSPIESCGSYRHGKPQAVAVVKEKLPP